MTVLLPFLHYYYYSLFNLVQFGFVASFQQGISMTALQLLVFIVCFIEYYLYVKLISRTLKKMSMLMDSKSNILRKTRSISPMIDRKQSRKYQLSRSSLQEVKLSNLIISTKQIRFYYRGGHNQYAFNKELKLTNKTETRIGFKIKSNNPRNYDVSPSEQKIEKDSVCQIRMRLFIQNGNIQKYWMDRFMIEWGAIDQNGITVYSQKVILKVQVETTINTIKTKEMKKDIKKSQKEIKYYEDIKLYNQRKLDRQQQKLDRLKSEPRPWTIGMPTGIFLAVLSFVLGYIIF